MRKSIFVMLPLAVLLASPVRASVSRSTDQEVATSIQARLYRAHISEPGRVQVSFENGVATLTGTVDSVGAKMDAERAARKQTGVIRVVNNLRVDTEDISPRQILERARKAIVTYYAYTIFDNMNLQARGNTLIVSGQVTQPYKKQDIGNFLARVKGVASLENNLEVLPTSIYDDQLRSAIARAIYNDPYFIHYANQALPPIHIIVKNGNVALDGVVATSLDRQKAENDARFAATFFSLENRLRVEG